MSAKKIALAGVFISLALVLNVMENFIPVRNLVPGAKLGLANVITMLALYSFTKRETFTILILRIILGSFFGGGVSGLMYSAAGGILSFITMVAAKAIGGKRISIIGVSVTGAYFHSVGQMLMAAMIIQNIRIFTYLPLLLAASIATGIGVGYASKALLERLRSDNVEWVNE